MGLSIWHLLILLAIVLLFFGPGRLPSLTKSIGESIRSFKKGLEDPEIDVTDRNEQLASRDRKADTVTEKKKKEEV